MNTRLSLESLLRLFDEVEDFVIATVQRMHRTLSRKPPERRHAPRPADGTIDRNSGL